MKALTQLVSGLFGITAKKKNCITINQHGYPAYDKIILAGPPCTPHTLVIREIQQAAAVRRCMPKAPIVGLDKVPRIHIAVSCIKLDRPVMIPIMVLKTNRGRVSYRCMK